MRTDLIHKRGQFIGKVNSLLQEFHYTSPETMFKLVDTYAISCYGSPLWDLTSNEAEKLYKSWNVLVRNILDLDRKTHRFLIEPLSGHLHLKTMLMSRFVSFYKGLVDSPKFTVRFLARLAEKDMRTVMGKTLHYLLGECNCEQLEDLTPHIVKKSLVYKIAAHDQTWQVALAQELLGIKNEDATVQGFTKGELRTIFDYVCTE